MTRDTQEPASPSAITAHAVCYLALFFILVLGYLSDGSRPSPLP